MRITTSPRPATHAAPGPSTDTAAADDLRARNARRAAHYDDLPYEPPALPAIAPPRALGLGAVHGLGPPPGEALSALDLGCGGGALLAELSPSCRGRLVGVDLSAAACERARARLAPLHGHVEIRQGDLLDLDAEALGQFDLIYCVGVLSVLPAPVRRSALAVMARCLRPGGVAVLSYYAGPLPRVRACLSGGLRAAVDEGLPRPAQVRQARQRLEALAAELPPPGPLREVLAQALALTAGGSDGVLFHESLSGALEVLETSALEAELAPAGLSFLGYFLGTPFGALPTSRARALGADAFDFVSGGGYRYAAFGRPALERPPTLRSERLRLRTALRRAEPAGPSGAARVYAEPSGSATVARPATQALLDELAAGPATFAALAAAAARRLAAEGQALSPLEEALAERELLRLWQAGLIGAEAIL